MKISHSQINLYSTCGQRYKYHYVERLRDPLTSGALLFGSALDKTINTLLLDKKSNNINKKEYYKDLFTKTWTLGEINKEVVPLRMSPLVVYADSDFDPSLLTDDKAKQIGFSSLEKLQNFHKMMGFQKKTKGINSFGDRERGLFNAIHWECLLVKGHLMVEAYFEEVLPKIKEVLDVQTEITLSNDNTDSVTGFIDAILDFGDGPVICDLKTSSINYDYNSASTSPQLAIYKHAVYDKYHSDKTAFIVLYKRMLKESKKCCTVCKHDGSGSRAKTCDATIEGKRCSGSWEEFSTSKAKVEIIQGNIDEQFEHNVVDNYDVILKGIKSGVFYKNWNSCTQSYGICPYYSLCHNKGKKDLIKLE